MTESAQQARLLVNAWAVHGEVLDPHAGITHGWRFWRIKNDRLVSPIVSPGVVLPGHGRLRWAFFLPRAEDIRDIVTRIRRQRWYDDFAVTFGRVSRPLCHDRLWLPHVVSLQASQYEALLILTDSVRGPLLKEYYELPVVRLTEAAASRRVR
ncbi:hypothetical protein ABQE57_16985 [Mycolicibacterium elephantis]